MKNKKTKEQIKNNKYFKIDFRVDKQTYDFIKQLSVISNTNISSIVREAVYVYKINTKL